MSTARNVIEAVSGLREDAGFDAKQADGIGVAAARIAEASADRIADRLLIRLGAWTLGVVTLSTAIATAVIVTAIQLSSN